MSKKQRQKAKGPGAKGRQTRDAMAVLREILQDKGQAAVLLSWAVSRADGATDRAGAIGPDDEARPVLACAWMWARLALHLGRYCGENTTYADLVENIAMTAAQRRFKREAREAVERFQRYLDMERDAGNEIINGSQRAEQLSENVEELLNRPDGIELHGEVGAIIQDV